MHRQPVREFCRMGICCKFLAGLQPDHIHCTPASCSRHSPLNVGPWAIQLGGSRSCTRHPLAFRGHSPSTRAQACVRRPGPPQPNQPEERRPFGIDGSKTSSSDRPRRRHQRRTKNKTVVHVLCVHVQVQFLRPTRVQVQVPRTQDPASGSWLRSCLLPAACHQLTS